VIVDTGELGEKMADEFDKKVNKIAFRLELVDDKILWHGIVDGEEKTFDKDPYTTFWQRLGIDVLRILPIESQL
jgi:putative cardiolipin synthase